MFQVNKDSGGNIREGKGNLLKERRIFGKKMGQKPFSEIFWETCEKYLENCQKSQELYTETSGKGEKKTSFRAWVKIIDGGAK